MIIVLSILCASSSMLIVFIANLLVVMVHRTFNTLLWQLVLN